MTVKLQVVTPSHLPGWTLDRPLPHIEQPPLRQPLPFSKMWRRLLCVCALAYGVPILLCLTARYVLLVVR